MVTTFTSHRPTQRICDILVLLSSKNGEGLSLSAISNELKCPKSTLSPVLHTLSVNRMLLYDEEKMLYYIGSKAYEIGTGYVQRASQAELILDIMKDVVSGCSESCHFAELVGSNILYLYKVDSPQSIRMFSAPGKTLPANATALGKALLSNYTIESLKELFNGCLPKVTKETICDFDVLYEQLQKIKQTQVAYECEENSEYIRCIAVPILKNGIPYRALSVAVPTFRYSQEVAYKIEASLLDAKEKIESLLLL